MPGTCSLRILFCFSLIALLACEELYADDIRIFGDWSYLSSLIDTEYRDDRASEKSKTERYKQIYRLDLSKELFPNLTLDAGTQMEKTRQLSEFNNDESNSRNTTIAPYIEAELRTNLYSMSAGYQERYERDYQRSTIDNLTTRDKDRDYVRTYTLRGEWRPVELPRFDLSYLHTERHDEPFTQRDEASILQFNSRYDYENYEFQYGYFRNEDKKLDADRDSTGSVTNTHNGRVRYTNTYMGGKVTLNASLRGEYTEQTFSGSGLRDFSVVPSGSSFYFLDTDHFPNNNTSTDYVVSAGFADNLNLNSTDVIDVGLDFGEAVDVDMLQLTLDGKLETGSNISASANWSVYVSTDQESWVSRGVTSVEYFREEDRLEIRFSPKATHDYVLLVYVPPLITNQIQPVFITSIRAFVSKFLDDGSELETHVINAQLGVGWQITDKTKVLYDLNLQERQSSLFDDQSVRMTNGLTVLHLINKIFSASGRASVSDTWEQSNHDSSRYNYSAKLNARYLETLSQALIYSGSLDQEAEGDSTSNSLLLHTNAELYRGWDVAFDQGYSWQSPADGVDSTSFFVRIENSLVPHRRFNLLADYTITWDKEVGAEMTRSDSARLRATWIPSDTLSLYGVVRLRANEEETDVFWEYGVSWMPLRDGTLQCTLNYSEEEDANGNRTRSLSPSLSWDMTRYANLSARYSQGTDESNSKIDEFKTFLVNLKIYYD
ncbi:MAG: hypothetical protein RBR06_08560 [Desulfuromonadaceae bacterium]|nr:hypothetical protein [Desulfuromonadaceae bacterium]